tara:strand:- start:3637 stop:4995 length:1359 start_codon:yes stop_codon:yes gene_type:complete
MFQNKYNRIVLPFLFFSDLVIVVLSYYLINIDFNELLSKFDIIVILSLLWTIPALYFNSYNVPRVYSYLNSIKPTFYTFIGFSILYIFYILLDSSQKPSPFFHFQYLAYLFLLQHSFSFSRFYFFHKYRLKGKNTRFGVLLGNFTKNQIENINSDALNLGYHFIKIFSHPELYLKELNDLINKHRIDIIFYSNSDQSLAEPISVFCDNHGIRLKIIIPLSSYTAKRTGLDMIGDFSIMDVRHEPLLYIHNRLIKRILDIIVSFFSIVLVLSWLPILVKLAQIFTYPGPLLFVQDRVGRDGKIFKLYKFRTMKFCSDLIKAKKGWSEKTKKLDKRVTSFGRFLRRTNLDEYPQFINVFFGSMSTVGPRPHMVGEDLFLEKKIPKYRIRRFVKPGVTGLAAIKGYRGGTDDLKLMEERIKFDIWYLENWKFFLDLKIIFVTVWQMLTFRIPKAY